MYYSKARDWREGAWEELTLDQLDSFTLARGATFEARVPVNRTPTICALPSNYITIFKNIPTVTTYWFGTLRYVGGW